MTRVKLLISSFIISLLTIFSPSIAFAGGGPVALYAFPLRPFDQTKTFILEAETTTYQPCDQIKPSFAFKDSVDGDSIIPLTPPDDGTYINQHFNTGSPNFIWKELCITYVQAKSGVTKQRTVTVTVTVNGKTEERETLVAFGDDSYSKQLQSFGRVNDYDNTPHPDVISERFLGGPKREVKLQWQKIPWATKYAVFARQILSNGTVDQTPLSPIALAENTQATINIAAFSEFYINAIACKTDDPCINNKQDGYSFLLPKMQSTTSTTNVNVPQEVKITPTIPSQETQPSIIPQPTSADQKTVEDLNQKVASLESKLNESQNKQSILEQRISDLVSFIKRIFPFFK